MKNHCYYLDDEGVPYKATGGDDGFIKWARWFHEAQEENNIRVDQFADDDGNNIKVSTIFLGFDHAFRPHPNSVMPPVLWETLIFGGGELDHDGARCAGTRDNAIVMHREQCERVCRHLGLDNPSARSMMLEEFPHLFAELVLAERFVIPKP